MKYWVEKTYPSKREEHDFKTLLMSPKRDEGGSDSYSNMRKVSIGDIVLHINQDTKILEGYSQISSLCETININNKSFYSVNLINFIKFDSKINIDEVLSNPKNQSQLAAIRDSGQERFYQQRGNKFYLQQGAYLTGLSEELYNLITTSLKIQRSVSPDEDVNDDEDSLYPEGRKSYSIHKRKERNRKLIKEAKKRFKEKNNGELHCECCDFNFSSVYGDIGENFIEAHHTIPIHQISENHESKISDIALLCSNCHRMVHKGRPELLTVTELQNTMS